MTGWDRKRVDSNWSPFPGDIFIGRKNDVLMAKVTFSPNQGDPGLLEKWQTMFFRSPTPLTPPTRRNN